MWGVIMTKNDEEIKISNGKVNNVNYEKLKEIEKIKIYKLRIAAVVASAVILLSLFTLGKKKDVVVSPIPDTQICCVVPVYVGSGDTIEEIARLYYSDECEGVYNSFQNFEDAIREQNNTKADVIHNGDTIGVPVIVDKENPFYQRILEVQKQIDEIKENNLWVRYTVKHGDNLSSLAALASGDFQETPILAGEIMRKNNITSASLLKEGSEIWIMNPELAPVKEDLNLAYKALYASLKVGESKLKK